MSWRWDLSHLLWIHVIHKCKTYHGKCHGWESCLQVHSKALLCHDHQKWCTEQCLDSGASSISLSHPLEGRVLRASVSSMWHPKAAQTLCKAFWRVSIISIVGALSIPVQQRTNVATHMTWFGITTNNCWRQLLEPYCIHAEDFVYQSVLPFDLSWSLLVPKAQVWFFCSPHG